jgi:hypothetical protein
VPSRTSGKPKSKGKSEDEGAPRLALRVYANDDGKTGKITKDESLTSTFAALIDQLLKGTTAAPTSDWDVFAGTPILLNDSDEPDDNALRWNLVGHVALALSGVTKWVYASWYEHLFAVRVVSALLAPPKCPDGLASLATHVRPVIATKQFYWAPEDHHDHWHIVFGGADVKRTDSLGPSHYAPDPNTLRGWILFWDTLGVDLEAFRLDLEKREPQHPQLFHGIATERQRLLELLIALKTSNAALSDDDRQARSALRDQCLLTLATEIQTVTWKEIPSLAEGTTFEEWVRNADLVKRYTMPEGYKGTRWKEWPSDVEDAPPEESVPPSADDPEDPD